MTTDPIIAPLSPADLPAVTALASMAPETPHWPWTAWAAFASASQAVEPQHRRALVVRSAGGAINGVIAFTVLPPTTELELVLVHPGARRRGLGRRAYYRDPVEDALLLRAALSTPAD